MNQINNNNNKGKALFKTERKKKIAQSINVKLDKPRTANNYV